MTREITRREFVDAAAIATFGSAVATAAHAADSGATMKIIGVACSPRRGMTTAKAVQTALDAAKSVNPRIAVELLDLGGLQIGGYSAQPPADDFTPMLTKLQDPALAGLIIGSPAYFRGLSALCKTFIERCAPLREPKMLLADKPVAAIATGGYRNGGQELVIEQIQTAMLCFGMIAVGGAAPAFQGGTLLTTKDSIDGDEIGLITARNTGRHLAEVALKLRPAIA